jgi:hypothetical protein
MLLLQLQLADVQMFNDDIYVFSSFPIIYFLFNYLYLTGPMTTRRRLNRTLRLRLRYHHISFPFRITGRAFAKAEGQKKQKSFVKLGNLYEYNTIYEVGGTAMFQDADGNADPDPETTK